ncbi:MAG: M23 family metallopeptidase [Maricaulaceae bacterium]|nr:M23 family metallopeptidase [Maricaulaceae bacterium]
MRRFAILCAIAVLGAAVAACSTPRDPARVDHRGAASRGGPPAAVLAGGPQTPCAPGSSYTVRSGDTLSEIAQRCGVRMGDLAAANGLSAPFRLREGQTLTMPRPAVHVVQTGENLYRIGLRYGVDYQDLGALNGIPPPYHVRTGQEIRLPGGAQVRAAATPAARPQSTPARNTAASSSGAAATTAVTATTRPAPADPPPPPASSAPRFDWPLRGQIVSTFGPKPDGRRNDGVNIRANEGDPVRASADGVVVYAGDELQGYGNLVLVRHEGGWVTAYAHNRRLRVSEGDRVTRGQVIAEAGSTGSVDTTQLHFEIRRGVTPEDPMRHLPSS